MGYKHLLLAVNLDEYAEYLISKAAEQARIHHALFSVIHMDPDLGHLEVGVREYDAVNIDESEHYESVAAMRRLLKGTNYPLYKHLFYTGYLEDQLITAISQFEVDLLVLGHHQCNLFRQLFLSPSEPLVRQMPCDLLLLKLND
ncbi:universal stress protein [Photobacterium atrarenae]|uniref:Universal stress protein n=1 Tax=Photobacterium atrarenae TaxID=865757 RepID=A0ABY5GNJ7_9GAMM|nr:universal stress protein [Photobacterium atrarenae]UTV30706.1 universal stress protein [Photobacterium atrarenae]